MLLKKSIHSRNIHIQTTSDNVVILENPWKETKSANIYEKYYRLKILYCELVNDYEEIIKFTLQSQKDFDKKKINPIRFDENSNFKKVSQDINERWKLFKSYLNFAIPERQLVKRFTFKDLYTSMTFYNRNKGYNISLVILEFLHFLGKKI